MPSLHIGKEDLKYRAMIGTGGIGSGLFFVVNGNHTLGREESRSGHFVDRRDYCKLHIITHYVQTLLGSGFDTVPIGKVGDDGLGKKLYDEMRECGMNMEHVVVLPGVRTLMCICFAYPDGSGGNLTPDDSACSEVDVSSILAAEAEFRRYAHSGIALAVPEVPLEIRAKLLELGTRYDFFRVASFTSEEMSLNISKDMLRKVDLLALNLEEAAVAASTSVGERSQAVVEAAMQKLCQINSRMFISITAGQEGSWSWDGTVLHHVPAFRTKVESTAGAGDCHLAGIIVGLAGGLALREAQELATLAAALSVTSPHTISKTIGKETLRRFADRIDADLADDVWRLLQ
jgi:sugar/nucleoside kinase (ribokinase family)